jgi:tRNA pseudouridine38-40 synthase
MRVALKFAYNGRNFSGYARQPYQETVEGTLLQMLGEQGFITDIKHACFRTASRTDKGVSALGNVCAFDTAVLKEEILPKLTKGISEIFVYGIQLVDSVFYPRYATRRDYRYYLRRDDLDGNALRAAAALFTGEHNFQNFARVEPLKNPVRTIDRIVITEQEPFFVIDFSAQTYLWNQIRRIISALQKAGKGILTLEEIRYALDHPEQRVDFQVAPPEPLILKEVVYDFSFDYTKGYAEKLAAFEQALTSSL